MNGEIKTREEVIEMIIKLLNKADNNYIAKISNKLLDQTVILIDEGEFLLK